jgi:hypothetical protein
LLLIQPEPYLGCRFLSALRSIVFGRSCRGWNGLTTGFDSTRGGGGGGGGGGATRGVGAGADRTGIFTSRLNSVRALAQDAQALSALAGKPELVSVLHVPVILALAETPAQALVLTALAMSASAGKPGPVSVLHAQALSALAEKQAQALVLSAPVRSEQGLTDDQPRMVVVSGRSVQGPASADGHRPSVDGLHDLAGLSLALLPWFWFPP